MDGLALRINHFAPAQVVPVVPLVPAVSAEPVAALAPLPVQLAYDGFEDLPGRVRHCTQ